MRTLVYILVNSLMLISEAKSNLNNFFVQRSLNPLNESLVLEFIHSLHEHYEYRSLIFMASANVSVSENFWIQLPIAPRLVITNLQFSLNLHIGTPVMCVVFTHGGQDALMELNAEDKENLHANMMTAVFVLNPLVKSDELLDVLNETVVWIGRKNYLNVAVITAYNNNLYKLESYPKLTIVNKTLNWLPEDFRVQTRLNFNGYAIKTPICYDFPRVFITDKNVLSGSSARLFVAFLDYVNATIKDAGTCTSIRQPNDIPTTLQMIRNNTIDISINSFTQMKYVIEGTSYPTAIDDYCVMVPTYFRPLQHLYLQVIFDKYIYMLVGFSTAYIASTIWLCTPAGRRDLGLCFLQAISTLLSLPPLNAFNTNNLRMRIILILIVILGFSLVNVFVTELTSILVTTITNSPIDSVEDVIAANLRILVVDYEYPTVEDNNFPRKFLDRITLVNRSFIDKHREDLNTSYGYFIQSDRWQFLKQQQRYLTKPLFTMSSICLGPFFHVFPVSLKSPLAAPLKHFTLLSSAFGLQIHWGRKTFRDALFMDVVNFKREESESMPLSIEFFKPILLIWSIGLAVSLIVFLYELKEQLNKICLQEIIKRF